ncbi:MAG TPA: LacI family DNA-binding transcriptional regulator [Candidatus Merdenecus merdavium]|nr:LacI family DNA-binding transcriptional regulator [Candidatus Merdenecus merdavium]
MSVTIKDIANDTNLSLATISKYLNGKNILPENQALIEASIKKLNYMPNKQARMLRSKKTNTIAILLPSISDYFWGSICSYIEDYMQQHHFSTIISSYNSKYQNYLDVFRQLMSAQIDGVIIVPELNAPIALIELLQNNHVPVVYLDQLIESPLADVVTSNNFQGAYTATEYFIKHGHKLLGVIAGEKDSYTTKERIRGFHSACNDYQIPIENRMVVCSDYTSKTADLSFKKMMNLATRPTAILFLGYFMTIAAITGLKKYKIHLPEDLSIISFDDDEIFSAFDPPITVVVQNLQKLGYECSELLLKRIRNNYSKFPERKIIETKLLERHSVTTKKYQPKN